ncbi:MAG: hypothetical protein HYX69_13680 [Planctomycetia bacterium]|nr:hypothetical protein [Planctomycetia bacterium]
MCHGLTDQGKPCGVAQGLAMLVDVDPRFPLLLTKQWHTNSRAFPSLV